MINHDEFMRLLADAVGADAVAEGGGFSPEELKAALPAATYASFAFDCADVLGNRVLFASPTADMKPAALAAQLRRVSQAAGCDAACVLDDPTPYLKKRLMAEGAGFVTARGEFFLPALLHLKPVREKKPAAAESELNATGKSVFLHLLYADSGSTVSEMSERLGLSRAGVQRACEDLLGRGLAEREVGGPTRRTAIYGRIATADYLEAGWGAFGPAARRVLTVPADAADGLLLCGLSALSARTLLNPPAVPEYAVQLKDAGALGEAVPEGGEATARVHVLPYNPAPFAQGGAVDPFTMLKTVARHDERIDMAIDEVKEEMGWPR